MKIKNRTFDSNGHVLLTEQGAIEAMYGHGITPNSTISSEQDINEYNRWFDYFDFSGQPIGEGQVDHSKNKTEWMIPESYRNIDIERLLLERTTTQTQKDRVLLELQMFRDRGLEQLLRFVIYLVDTMRSKDLVWGVGRGSSVSSYVLFLLGLHKIDSLKYDLNINEFFK